MNRRERTDSPRAALMTDAPIRKNTHPMAAGGSMSAAVTSQTMVRTVIPPPAITSDRRPSPYAVSVYRATKRPSQPGPSWKSRL
jgi:hypothetical protein